MAAAGIDKKLPDFFRRIAPPATPNDHYRQVYFDTNMAIREVLGDGTFPGTAYPLAVHDVKVAAGAA